MAGKEDWIECRLGDVLTLKRGYDLPQRERIPGPVPIVSSSGVTGFHKEAKVKGPGVVTGRYGTLGKAYYVPGDFWPLNTSLYVKDFKGNDRRFIYYFLQCQGLQRQNVAGAVPGVNRNYLHQLPVRVPSLLTQRKIAAILSAYDHLIENSTRRIQILEEIAQTIYREWFVEFRFPGHEKARMIPIEQNYDATLPAEIHEGWEIIRYKDLLVSYLGGDWGSEEPNGNENCRVRIIRGADFQSVRSGNVIEAPSRFIAESSLSKRILKKGDIILENSVNASSRCVGSSILITQGLLDRIGQDAICASFCKNFRLRNPRLSSIVYINLQYLRNENRMEYFQHVAANGIGNFQSKRFVESEAIVLPKDSNLLSYMIKTFENLTTTIYADQITELRKIRDLLLPRLVLGELEVVDIESLVGLPE